MDSNVIVEVCRVIEGDAFEALEVGGKLLDFTKSPTSLLLDTNFDIPDPTTLKFDPLSNDLFLEPRRRNENQTIVKEKNMYRSLMSSV